VSRLRLTTHPSDDIVRAGVNLKFNPGGSTVAAKQ
jgi:hypothetical protein